VRVAVLSDIHSNVVALDAVLDSAGPVDAIWHLGDVVGYGPEPDAVVDRLAAAGAVGVAGNHDRAATGGSEIDWFNPDARAAMEWTRGRISSTTSSWLAAQPVRRTESETLLVHGSPRDPIWEYVMSSAVAGANLRELETRMGLFGHTHVPMIWAERDGRIDGISPRPAATIRGRAGSSSTWPKASGRGIGSRTTSRRSRRRCSTPGSRSASQNGSAMACDVTDRHP